jgi:hypothetical protein
MSNTPVKYIKAATKRCLKCGRKLSDNKYSIEPQGDGKTIIIGHYSCVCGATVDLRGDLTINP